MISISATFWRIISINGSHWLEIGLDGRGLAISKKNESEYFPAFQFQSRLILIQFTHTVPLRHQDSKNRNVTFAAEDLSGAYTSFAETNNRNHLKDGGITQYSRKYIAV